jgi:hypothetical protein
MKNFTGIFIKQRESTTNVSILAINYDGEMYTYPIYRVLERRRKAAKEESSDKNPILNASADQQRNLLDV